MNFKKQNISKYFNKQLFFNKNANNQKDYKLFGIIPFVKIKWEDAGNVIIKYYYLFAIIPFFKTRRNNNTNTLTYWLFCFIPLLKLSGLEQNKVIMEINSTKEDILNELQVQKFRETNIAPNTVAVVEMDCHGEVFPSIVNYFLRLGYKVHLFLASDAKDTTEYKPLTRTDFDIEIFYIREKMFCDILANSIYFTNYKYVFFPTIFEAGDYLQDAICKYSGNNIYYINHCSNPAIENNLSVQAKFLYDELFEKNRVFSIKPNVKNIPNFAVCTYFGDNIKPHKKNEITTFICGGGAWKSKLRNFDLLLASAKTLTKKHQFKLLFIGISEQNLPQGFEEIKDYIQIVGRTGYTDFYDKVESGDFILWNIDNTCEDYNKYLYHGTSGNYGLSLGFHKISIIEQKLAETHNFNEENALLYTDNLVEVMEKAIKMSNSDYKKMSEKLVELKNGLENMSLKNMKRVFGEA